jgi:hypothetical protein
MRFWQIATVNCNLHSKPRLRNNWCFGIINPQNSTAVCSVRFFPLEASPICLTSCIERNAEPPRNRARILKQGQALVLPEWPTLENLRRDFWRPWFRKSVRYTFPANLPKERSEESPIKDVCLPGGILQFFSCLCANVVETSRRGIFVLILVTLSFRFALISSG